MKVVAFGGQKSAMASCPGVRISDEQADLVEVHLERQAIPVPAVARAELVAGGHEEWAGAPECLEWWYWWVRLAVPIPVTDRHRGQGQHLEIVRGGVCDDGSTDGATRASPEAASFCFSPGHGVAASCSASLASISAAVERKEALEDHDRCATDCGGG